MLTEAGWKMAETSQLDRSYSLIGVKDHHGECCSKGQVGGRSEVGIEADWRA